MTPFRSEPSWLRIIFVVLLFSATILALALAMLFYFGGKGGPTKYVDDEKYQAVFLNNGQVYFGQIKDISGDYIDLRDIYYLRTQESAADAKEGEEKQANLQLNKLGCELHRPTDQMLINRDEVTFWENISAEGDVVTNINKWKKANPNGQKCNATTNSTEQSPTNTNPTTETETPQQ